MAKINKVFEITRIICQKKTSELDTLLKYIEEETEDCASIYDFDIKNSIPESVYRYYSMKEEPELWRICKEWDEHRHTCKYVNYEILVRMLQQQYVIIIMINSLLKRREIELKITEKFNCFEFILR